MGTMKDDWWKTLDEVTIVDGLRVWDYDLRRTTVDVSGTRQADPQDEFHQYWDGWFEMKTTDGVRTSSMNGVRMWARHPRTGEPA
jgi:hypothetical protein